MPTNDERRKIAAELRENRDPLTPYNLVDYIFDDPWNHDSGEEVAARLADLIEPQEWTCHIAEAFHAMALELADARTELERQRRLSSIDRERAEMVSQLEDENLELKKRLGFFGDLTPPVSWYAAMREENERLNRELMEAMR